MSRACVCCLALLVTISAIVPAAAEPAPVEPPATLRTPFGASAARGAQEAWAAHLGVDVELQTASGMELVLVPPGAFQMGSPAGEKGRYADEDQVAVALFRPFWVGKYEVTLGQFRQFVASENYRTEAERDGKGGLGWSESGKKFSQDPKYTWEKTGWRRTDEQPVVNVTWNDAVAFCAWLSRQDGLQYRLPTEAEWEWSCRAGTVTAYFCGNNAELLAAHGNVTDASFTAKPLVTFDKTAISARDGFVFTAPAGRFRANAFGLYDLHGNVWELCSDWYADKLIGGTDPAGPGDGSYRVFRGGGWNNTPRDCRSASRGGYVPGHRGSGLGIRVAAVPSAEP